MIGGAEERPDQCFSGFAGEPAFPRLFSSASLYESPTEALAAAEEKRDEELKSESREEPGACSEGPAPPGTGGSPQGDSAPGAARETGGDVASRDYTLVAFVAQSCPAVEEVEVPVADLGFGLFRQYRETGSRIDYALVSYYWSAGNVVLSVSYNADENIDGTELIPYAEAMQRQAEAKR